jgi:hypothetical protein
MLNARLAAADRAVASSCNKAATISVAMLLRDERRSSRAITLFANAFEIIFKSVRV